jgi:hypothetical protein
MYIFIVILCQIVVIIPSQLTTKPPDTLELFDIPGALQQF